MRDSKRDTVFRTLWERGRVGWFGRMALKHVYYQMWNESPVQDRCMRQGVQGWCTGMTQRDGMGREVGGRFRTGNTCKSMADSCQCMAKPLQYCKVISLQLKINKFIFFKKNWLKTQHSKNEDHGIRSHHFMENRWGNNGNSDRLSFGGLQNHCRWWLQSWN